jgi:signal transduction histidine kinase
VETIKNTAELLHEIEELKIRLFEANSIIEAIREGSIDALVLTKEGNPNVYSLETADYTYRILIEKMGEGALSISEEGLILYCNDYFSRLVNLPTNRIVGTYINSYVDSAGQFHRLKNEVKNGPSKGEITLNINGKKLPIYLSLTSLKPMLDAIGIVVTDLTEKRKHEEAVAAYQYELELKVNELHKTNVNLEQFIHVISHDIKQPLRKIATYSSELNTNKSDGLSRAELSKLNVISNSALRLNSLVDDLSKYAFSATPVETQDVDLGKVLKEVVEDMEMMITENNILIKSQSLPVVTGTKVQMRQLFSNLLINIIQSQKKETSFHISITSEITDCVDIYFPNKKFHKISVHCHGSEKNPCIQLPNENDGNGIGLSICKKIMENHLGKMEINNFPVNGNIFNLYFPVE